MEMKFDVLVITFMEKLSVYEKALYINSIEDYTSDIPSDIMEQLESVLDIHKQEYFSVQKELISALALILLAGAEMQKKYLGYVLKNYNQDAASESRELTEELLDAVFNECDSFKACDSNYYEEFLKQFRVACN